MLAVTVTPGGSPALRELPSPTTPPGGVLVRVRACGLCGSDVEKLRPGGAPAGTVLGHEIAGVVVDGAAARRAARRARPSRPLRHLRALPGGPRAALPRLRRQRARAGRVLRADGCLERARRARRAAAARSRERPGRLVRRAARPACCAASKGSPARPPWWPERGRSACSPRRLCARAATHVRVLEPEPGRARRAAELGFEPPAEGERFSGALLSAARRVRRCAAAARARRPARALQRRRRCSRSTSTSSIAASSSCAACGRPHRATCARRWR